MGTDCCDNRKLAINFQRISLYNKKSNSCIELNLSDVKVFGFYSPEVTGTWSAGKKSCICFSNIPSLNNETDIIIEAHPFINSFRSCKISIITSTGHRGSAQISAKAASRIRLRKPIFSRNKRLVVGDFSRLNEPHNISNLNQRPTLSIIILNHNNSILTRLAAMAAVSSNIKAPFEVLCFNNGCDMQNVVDIKTSEVDMRFFKKNKNFGFSEGNNMAAKEARGEYLLFLNNDAFLDAGAVDEMLRAFKDSPDCRITGSVLRFPDGTMQEAGATLRPDAHSIRHGRNDAMFKTHKLPRFKSVDYVSGACLMIRKVDFLEMGGFDEKYSPAYYEDTDLCMRSLLYGKKVYLASRANCYHIENATTSTIENGAWASRMAERNREIFLKDWGAYLASRDPKDLPWHLKNVPPRRCDAAR